MATGVKFKRRKFDGAPLIGGDVVTATADQLNRAGTLADTLATLTATAAELNAVADMSAQAVTATADGLTTGTILPASKVVVITSAAATDAAALPGIAANALGIGHTIRGRVTANGCEMITPAASNETINGTDADGTNQLDVPANTAFEAWVESATGWCVAFSATLVTPDND